MFSNNQGMAMARVEEWASATNGVCASFHYVKGQATAWPFCRVDPDLNLVPLDWVQIPSLKCDSYRPSPTVYFQLSVKIFDVKSHGAHTDR